MHSITKRCHSFFYHMKPSHTSVTSRSYILNTGWNQGGLPANNKRTSNSQQPLPSLSGLQNKPPARWLSCAHQRPYSRGGRMHSILLKSSSTSVPNRLWHPGNEVVQVVRQTAWKKQRESPKTMAMCSLDCPPA